MNGENRATLQPTGNSEQQALAHQPALVFQRPHHSNRETEQSKALLHPMLPPAEQTMVPTSSGAGTPHITSVSDYLQDKVPDGYCNPAPPHPATSSAAAACTGLLCFVASSYERSCFIPCFTFARSIFFMHDALCTV